MDDELDQERVVLKQTLWQEEKNLKAKQELVTNARQLITSLLEKKEVEERMQSISSSLEHGKQTKSKQIFRARSLLMDGESSSATTLQNPTRHSYLRKRKTIGSLAEESDMKTLVSRGVASTLITGQLFTPDVVVPSNDDDSLRPEEIYQDIMANEMRRRAKSIEGHALQKQLDMLALKEDTLEQTVTTYTEEKGELEGEKNELQDMLCSVRTEIEANSSTCEVLRKKLDNLDTLLDARDRFGCWLCNGESATSTDDECSTLENEYSRVKKYFDYLQGIANAHNVVPEVSAKSHSRPRIRSALKDEAERSKKLKVQFSSSDSWTCECQVKVHDDPDISTVDVGAALMRATRTRVATPHVSAKTVTTILRDKHNRTKCAAINFDENIQTREQPCDGMRSVRGRMTTPYTSGAVKFGPADDSPSDEGTKFLHRTRKRVATPFVHEWKEEGGALENSRVHFRDSVDVQTCWLTSKAVLRPIRSRFATPYYRGSSEPQDGAGADVDEAPLGASRTVSFNTNVIVERAETDPGVAMRPLRSRLTTPFVGEQALTGEALHTPLITDAAAGPSRLVSFCGNVNVERRWECGSPFRPSRSRIATPFLRGDVALEDRAPASTSVTFRDAELHCHTVARDMRPPRRRLPTPFISNNYLAAGDVLEGKVSIDDIVSVEERQLRLTSPTAFKPVRNRVATPMFPSEISSAIHSEMPPSASSTAVPEPCSVESPRNVRVGFTNFDETVEPISMDGENPRIMRCIRNRIITPYLREYSLAGEDDASPRGVAFDPAVASWVRHTSGQLRLVRSRTPTPHISQEAISCVQDKVKFQDSVDLFSQTNVGTARPVRARVATPFTVIAGTPCDDAASPKVAFVENVDLTEFDDGRIEVGLRRDPRNRFATPFSQQYDLHASDTISATVFRPEIAGTRHANFDEVVDLQETYVDSRSPMRAVKNRSPTTFAKQETVVGDSPADNAKVTFSTEVDTQTYKSSLMRPLRNRLTTPFASDTPLRGVHDNLIGTKHSQDGKYIVDFDPCVSTLPRDDASCTTTASTVVCSHIRSRIPTPFITEDVLHAHQQGLPRVVFCDAVHVAGTVGSDVEGMCFTRQRIATPFALNPNAQAQKVTFRDGNQFSDPDAAVRGHATAPFSPTHDCAREEDTVSGARSIGRSTQEGSISPRSFSPLIASPRRETPKSALTKVGYLHAQPFKPQARLEAPAYSSMSGQVSDTRNPRGHIRTPYSHMRPGIVPAIEFYNERLVEVSDNTRLRSLSPRSDSAWPCSISPSASSVDIMTAFKHKADGMTDRKVHQTIFSQTYATDKVAETAECLRPLSQLALDDVSDCSPRTERHPDLSLCGRQVEDYTITDEERTIIVDALSSLEFCAELGRLELNALADAMQLYLFNANEMVCREGDEIGSHFFILRSGKLLVTRENHVLNQFTMPGAWFGESVLFLHGVRKATVTALSETYVWGIEGLHFRDVIKYMYVLKQTELCSVITNNPILQRLPERKKDLFCEKVCLEQVVDGQILIHMGAQEIPKLYFPADGILAISPGGIEQKLTGHFGETSILFGKHQHSAVAIGPATVASITKEVAEDIFGKDLAHALSRNIVLKALEVSVFAKFTPQVREGLHEVMEIYTFPEKKPNIELPSDTRCIIAIFGELLVGCEETISAGEFFGDEFVISPDILFANGLPLKKKSSTVSVAVLRYPAMMTLLRYDSVDESLDYDEKIACVRDIFLFSTLSEKHLDLLANAFQPTTYMFGDRIMQQGLLSEIFYVVRNGTVAIKQDGKTIRTLVRGEYYGERSLLYDDIRSASIICESDVCVLWVLHKDVFTKTMPQPVIDYLEKRLHLQDVRMDLTDLRVLTGIGQGGFGVVKLVEHITTKTKYALKILEKDRIQEHGQEECIRSERAILAEIDHPFVARCVRTFKDEHQVYFLLELVTGGELLAALDHLGILDANQARFYIGSLILALEYLHTRFIAYRDLKPENVLLDKIGYIKLIDFGIAKKLTTVRTHTLIGTPQFMSPELILGKGYGLMTDNWSLGVCIYEFMVGSLPFGNNALEQWDIWKEILYSRLTFPKSFKHEAATSLIQGLLQKNPSDRLGSTIAGFQPIKELAFFDGFKWDQLLQYCIDPPFLPPIPAYATTDTSPVKTTPTAMAPSTRVSLVSRGGNLKFAPPIETARRSAWHQGPPKDWDAEF